MKIENQKLQIVEKLIPYADEWGPEYIVKVHDPETGMEGVLVIDNTALGPGKGGLRMTENVSEEEVFRLARTMTWKNALADIPFGGAKSGVRLNEGAKKDKKAVVQSFAKHVALFTPRKYISAPDINIGEKEMQWFVEATGNWRSATGKPANYCIDTFGKETARLKAGEPRPAGWRGGKCGIPHEFGSTGFGVAHSARITAELAGIDMRGATVAIHGFGNVGTFAYTYLKKMGANIISVADRSCALYNKKGFDAKKLLVLAHNHEPLSKYKGAEKIKPEKLLELPVDILIPASVTDIIHEGNKERIKTKMIVEGGNIPMREPIERELHKKGILIVPDFIANAGGVISSYAEYRGYNPKLMFKTVEQKITKTTMKVMQKSLESGTFPRALALNLARVKVTKKMRERKR